MGMPQPTHTQILFFAHLHDCIPQGHHLTLYQISFTLLKKLWRSSLHQDFAVKCGYHGNALSITHMKDAMYLHIKDIKCTKFHLNPSNLWKFMPQGI